MFLKGVSSYVACKSFYRMILNHSKQIWHLYLDNKDLLKSLRKNPLSYDFALFTHIWLPQENYKANQVHFFRDLVKRMCQDTTAARSLLVIRADYKPGGPIIVHLPYSSNRSNFKKKILCIFPTPSS